MDQDHLASLMLIFNAPCCVEVTNYKKLRRQKKISASHAKTVSITQFLQWLELLNTRILSFQFSQQTIVTNSLKFCSFFISSPRISNEKQSTMVQVSYIQIKEDWNHTIISILKSYFHPEWLYCHLAHTFQEGNHYAIQIN